MSATHERQGRAPAASIVRDEAVRFGPEGQLVGIVSYPPEDAPHSAVAAPAVIVLNAGVLHRVGPHRLHVSLTRRLAAGGFISARIDLGGIGDSTATSDAITFRESAVADTRAAMTNLGHMTGARRFVIIGVCAGADNAIATALADDRVAAIVIVDPAVYATPRSLVRELRQRALGAEGISQALRWAARTTRNRMRREVARLRRVDVPAEGREYPPAPVFGAQLGSLADRGVRVLAVYSGIHHERYNHEDQLFEAFPALRGRIDRAYFPDANHTFTQLEDQAALIDTTIRWIAGGRG
jgi:pimeloyl-ACP methyl ester carboxylesterase